jgi:outer membrane protein TolC
MTLRECIETALLNNRAVQIERINPRIARLYLSSSYGYYDPVFTAQAQSESSVDTGGFDPTDYSRDTVYDADSETVTGGLTGFLPTGLSYNLGGAYAHSSGVRNGDDFDSYKLGTAISARQPLLKNFWTDQGRTAIRINKKLVKMSELTVAYAVIDVINQVQQAYYELVFARDNLNVNLRLLRTKQETLTGVERQVEVGVLTRLDTSLASSQVARTESDLISASNAVAVAENILKTLLGFTATNWNSGRLLPSEGLIVLPDTYEVDYHWRRAYKQRPDLERFREDVERASIEMRFRRNQLFPSVDLIASYGLRGSDAIQTNSVYSADASLHRAFNQIENRDAPNHMIGVAFSTPLGLARERANFKAARAVKEQTQLLLKQKEELVLREVSDAVINVQSAMDRSKASRRAREYAAEALQAEEQKLAAGKSSLFFVLQLQTDLATAETSEIRARADYNKAVSQLLFADGSLMEHEGMKLEFE